jgi:hypothetical protein
MTRHSSLDASTLRRPLERVNDEDLKGWVVSDWSVVSGQWSVSYRSYRSYRCLPNLKSEIFKPKSFEVLPNLFRSKCADAIQTEAEHDPILFSKTHVERRKLCADGATVPGMTERHRGTD